MTYQPITHSCWMAGCQGIACFGRFVDLRNGKAGEWSCAQHRWPGYMAKPEPKKSQVVDGKARRGVTLAPETFQKQGQLI